MFRRAIHLRESLFAFFPFLTFQFSQESQGSLLLSIIHRSAWENGYFFLRFRVKMLRNRRGIHLNDSTALNYFIKIVKSLFTSKMEIRC